jgi:periplasmic divalent cation tolerance protein
MVYIFWTCSSREEAIKIIYGLLGLRLIACASLLGQVESFYWWQDKIEEGKEVKVILKTHSKHFESICAYILKQGSYQVPEIAQVAVSNVHAPYLSWLKDILPITP